MQKVLVSSCLLGEPVRYNGRDAKVENEILCRWVDEGRVVSVCPELTANLGVPRAAAEIIGANGFAVLDGFAAVLDEQGMDITRQMLAGAQAVLLLAQANGARVAVMKDGSPSCGRSYIYNGQFRGAKKRGEVGVTVALLQRHGLALFNEHQFVEAERHLKDLEMVRRQGC